MSRKLIQASLLLAGLAGGASALAQSPNGFASIIFVPLAVDTASFHTTLYVHNPGGLVGVSATFYGATGTADAGTAIDCGTHSIPAASTAEFDISTLCTFSGVSNFGTLKLVEQNPNQPQPISAYTRVQAAGGDGFSTEGFPIGNFADDLGKSVVLGLKRQAAAPGYQSNCFASSLGEAVVVDMALFDGSNAPVGTIHTFTLAANETVRLLDVFNAVGAPLGDYSNVRAEYTLGAGNVGNPSFSGFCTVQNNTSYGADFRIAKAVTPDDQGHLYSVTQVKDGLGGNLVIGATSKLVFAVFLQHPDYFSCRTVGDGEDNTEIQIKDPSGAVVAGGDNIKSIPKFYLGDKTTRGNGGNGIWTVEIGSRDGLGETKFNLQCKSGNGMSRPLVVGSVTDDF